MLETDYLPSPLPHFLSFSLLPFFLSLSLFSLFLTYRPLNGGGPLGWDLSTHSLVDISSLGGIMGFLEITSLLHGLNTGKALAAPG